MNMMFYVSSLMLITLSVTITSGSSSTYDILPADKYTWDKSYPQSCECKQDGATKSTCDYFACTCACDITAGVCDYNCCCDVDCTDSQINRFKSLDVCSYEGDSTGPVTMCYSSQDLQKINPRGPLSGQPTAEAAVGRALCVDVDNTAFKGEYYTDTFLQTSAIFATSDGEKLYDYIEPIYTIYKADEYYDQNDTIAAFYRANGGDFYSTSGVFSVPTADFTGKCIDNNHITYENNVETNTCVRSINTKASFNDICDNDQTVANYVTDLWIASSASLLASGTPTITNTLKVKIDSVLFRSYQTGAISTITSSWDANSCSTSSVNGATYSATNYTCDFDVYQSISSTAAICQGMVVGVDYTIYHDASDLGTITSVTASVTVSDVIFNSNTVSIQQTFSASFISQSTALISQENGNIVARAKSGNPGYIMGKPVLFGTLQSDVILEEVAGLTVPSSMFAYSSSSSDPEFGSSTCPTGTISSTGEGNSNTPVDFGYDSTSGCKVELTLKQLKEMCCEGITTCTTTNNNSPYTNGNGFPFFLSNNVDTAGYIGIFGNADPLDSVQWTPLTLSTSVATKAWSDSTSTCTNIPSGLQYEFLVAYSGEKTNPQNKIVGVSAKIVTSDWTWTQPYASKQSQAFPITVTTTFVFKDGSDLKGYAPPAPPVLFSVPYDVFYPFYSTNAASSTSSTSITIQVAVICMCIVTFIMSV